MIVDRYYYNRLSDKERKIYQVLYDGVMDRAEIIPVPVRGDFSDGVSGRVFEALTDDNPLIYFLNQSLCSMGADCYGNFAYIPQYFFQKEDIKKYNAKIQETVNKLIAKLHLAEGTEYEKELKVHDWICSEIEYDDLGTDINNPVHAINSHNIVGVFAHHKAQCEGIAKAVKVLLNAVNVRCIVAGGLATTDGTTSEHAWNIVNIGGEPYHLDCTFDLGERKNGFIEYDYFNVTDAQISVNHTLTLELPKCKSRKENYFDKNGLVFDRPAKLQAFIESGIEKGKREFSFRYDGNERVSEVSNKLMKQAAQKVSDIEQRTVKCSSMPNDEMRTGRIVFR